MVMGLLIMRSLLCSVWKSDVRVFDFWSRLWRREMLDLDIKSLAYQSHSFSFCVIFLGSSHSSHLMFCACCVFTVMNNLSFQCHSQAAAFSWANILQVSNSTTSATTLEIGGL